MKKAAFLTMDSLNGFVCYDHLLKNPMKKLGWSVDEISWKKKRVKWDNYDVVIVRSTWDYQSDPKKFIKVLEEINRSSARLENSLEIMKWNMNKNYLDDLEKKGVTIVKTIWQKSFNAKKLESYFEELNSEEIIIKPNISANADNTFRLKRDDLKSQNSKLKTSLNKKEIMIQPFMKNIISEGEYSLFYFDGNFSHAILKTPKTGDFRVQEEHGGILNPVNPDKRLKDQAEKILNKMSEIPLYGRVDLVRTDDNEFALMELELIEPSLYFNMDEKSAGRFSEIFDKKMKRYGL